MRDAWQLDGKTISLWRTPERQFRTFHRFHSRPSHSFWRFVLLFVFLCLFGLLVLVLFCVFGFVPPHDVEIQ